MNDIEQAKDLLDEIEMVRHENDRLLSAADPCLMDAPDVQSMETKVHITLLHQALAQNAKLLNLTTGLVVAQLEAIVEYNERSNST